MDSLFQEYKEDHIDAVYHGSPAFKERMRKKEEEKRANLEKFFC